MNDILVGLISELGADRIGSAGLGHSDSMAL